MDDLFVIPGTNMRVGLDTMIGIVPMVGDLVSQVISSYIIWEARRLGVSRFAMSRMIANSAIDTVVASFRLPAMPSTLRSAPTARPSRCSRGISKWAHPLRRHWAP